MATSVPTGPEAGLSGSRVALGVTVKVAVTVAVPTVTVMVFAPAVLDGMAIVLIKIPLLRVCVSPVFRISVPSYLMTMAALAAKLAPLIVTAVPAGPEVGVSESRVGPGVTVNAA